MPDGLQASPSGCMIAGTYLGHPSFQSAGNRTLHLVDTLALEAARDRVAGARLSCCYMLVTVDRLSPPHQIRDGTGMRGNTEEAIRMGESLRLTSKRLRSGEPVVYVRVEPKWAWQAIGATCSIGSSSESTWPIEIAWEPWLAVGTCCGCSSEIDVGCARTVKELASL